MIFGSDVKVSDSLKHTYSFKHPYLVMMHIFVTNDEC